jgi:hypothetical protein
MWRKFMSIDRRLLAIIGRRLPAIYDVIPRGPQNHFLEEIALNPQPLPPLELGTAIAAEFIRTAWFAHRFGLELEVAYEDLDDICPLPPKLPKFPHHWPPFHIPEPDLEWFTDFHLGFLTRVAIAAVEFEDTHLGELLNKAIERSVGSIKSVNAD